MRKLYGAAALLAVGAIIGGAIAPGAIAAQNVATITPVPGVPAPVNVLPSLLSAAKGIVNAPAGAANIAVLLATYAKQPAFWAAVKAQQTATATAAQTALLASTKTTFKVPAIPAGGFMKLVGGANVVMAGSQVGLMIGNGAVRLLGFKDGDVCASDGPGGVLRSVSAFTNGVDCVAYDMTQEAIAQANADASAGVIGALVCNGAGSCAKFLGYGITSSQGMTWCFDFSGPAANFAAFAVDGLYPGDGRYYGEAGNSDGFRGNAGISGRCVAYGGNPASSGLPPNNIGSMEAKSAEIYAYAWQNGNSYGGDPTVELGVADPERHIRCTLKLAGGGSVSALSAPFHESDGAMAPTVCPELPEGGVLEGWKIDLLGGPEELTLMEQDVTPEYGNWSSTYPECADGTCMLDLQRVDTSCFIVPGPCADWFSDPDKSSTYNCRYGEHAVPLSECNVYAPTFKPDATTTGQTYGDPETGEASQTTIPADQGAYGTPVLDPENNRVCFPTGWGVLNPVEWVTKPVQCALQWAFVPRPSAVQAVGNTVKTAFDETSIAQTGRLVSGLPALIPAGTSSCMGPPVSFEGLDQFGLSGVYYPLDACDEPMSSLASLAKVAMIAILGVLALLAVVRYFAAAIGFVGVGKAAAGDS